MVKGIPTLSTDGYVTSLSKVSDRLMAYYFVSDYLQSPEYGKHIVTFQRTFEKYHHAPTELAEMVQEELVRKFQAHFTYAECQVRVVDSETGEQTLTSAKYDLEIAVMVQHGGINYTLGYLINVTDSSTLKIFSINNNGYLYDPR